MKTEKWNVTKAQVSVGNTLMEDFDPRSKTKKFVDKLLGREVKELEEIEIVVENQQEIDTTEFVKAIEANYTKFTNKSMHIKGLDELEADLKEVYPVDLAEQVFMSIVLDFIDNVFAGGKHWSLYTNAHFNKQMRRVADNLIRVHGKGGVLTVGTQPK